jgi:hypothetical protein
LAKRKLDDDEISWMMKEFARKGCRGWKMAERVVSVGDEEQKLLDVVDHGTRRWSRIDSQGNSSVNFKVLLLTG